MTVIMESVEEQTEQQKIEAAARALAAANVEAAPETEAVYFFPNDREVRLIETDPTTLSDTEIVPYYFGASLPDGIAYRSAVALIRPEEAFRLPLPPGWGTWNDAVKLWPQE